MAIKKHNLEPLKVGSVVKLIPFEDLNDFYTYPMSEEGYRRAVLSKNSSILLGNERVEDKKLVVYPPVDMFEWLACTVYGNRCISVHGDGRHTTMMFNSLGDLYNWPLVVAEVLDHIGDVNRYRIAKFSMVSCDSEMDLSRDLPGFTHRPMWEPDTVFPFAVTDDFLIRLGYRLD